MLCSVTETSKISLINRRSFLYGCTNKEQLYAIVRIVCLVEFACFSFSDFLRSLDSVNLKRKCDGKLKKKCSFIIQQLLLNYTILELYTRHGVMLIYNCNALLYITFSLVMHGMPQF